jgi:hypothetical protein
MITADVRHGELRLLWSSISTFLAILEPVVRIVFGSLALLGVLKAIRAPHSPFLANARHLTGFWIKQSPFIARSCVCSDSA